MFSFINKIVSFFKSEKKHTSNQTVSRIITNKLSWELACSDDQVYQTAKPERVAWSNHLKAQIEKHYDAFMSAKDIYTLIPKGLTKEQNITLLAELFSVVAKYESSWNPSTTSKDVNGRSESSYLATGLFQMNVYDQRTYESGTSFTHEELKNPLNNITVGIAIAATVIRYRGKITFKKEEKSPRLRYFYATLLTNGSVGKTVIAEYKANLGTFDFLQ